MRHLTDHKRLGRTTPHRMAMLKNMASSLILHGRIQTTLPKAKELRRLADRLVTWGKKGTAASMRQARGFIHDRDILAKLFKDLAPRFASRNGGYTRIFKLNFRQGDQAPMALIEYLDNPAPTSHSKEKKPSEGKAPKQKKSLKTAEKKSKKLKA